MEKNTETQKKELYLIPHYFRYVGLILFLAVIAAAVLLKMANQEWFDANKEILKITATNAAIISLWIIACSQDKIEDEMTLSLRLKSISMTFFIGIGMVVIMPFYNMMNDKPYYDGFSVQNLIMYMIVSYIVLYQFRKRFWQ